MPDRQDEIEYLRRKARQFRELASTYDDAGASKMLDVARELAARAAELEEKTAKSRYRVYFRHRQFGIVGRDDFSAEDDRAATALAEVLCDACSDICDHFELWQGVRRVGTCHRGGCANPDARQLNEQAQAVIAEHEERLLDSRWAIASSQRLLESLRHLRA